MSLPSDELESRNTSPRRLRLKDISPTPSLKLPNTSRKGSKQPTIKFSRGDSTSSLCDREIKAFLRPSSRQKSEAKLRSRSPVIRPTGAISTPVEARSALTERRKQRSERALPVEKKKVIAVRRSSIESKVMNERKHTFVEGRTVESIRNNPKSLGLGSVQFTKGPVSFCVLDSYHNIKCIVTCISYCNMLQYVAAKGHASACCFTSDLLFFLLCSLLCMIFCSALSSDYFTPHTIKHVVLRLFMWASLFVPNHFCHIFNLSHHGTSICISLLFASLFYFF